jgi:hypothetical protein
MDVPATGPISAMGMTRSARGNLVSGQGGEDRAVAGMIRRHALRDCVFVGWTKIISTHLSFSIARSTCCADLPRQRTINQTFQWRFD